MSVDFSNKKIIMVHGLASKPPPEITHALWRHTLTENIRVETSNCWDAASTPMRTSSSPPTGPISCRTTSRTTRPTAKSCAYRSTRSSTNGALSRIDFTSALVKSCGSFFQDRGLDLVKLLAGALTVKDDVMTHFLRETELYDQDQYIADQIRAPLENALRRAWDEGREPIILAHSMGTFISYDVLWRFAHRKTAGFGNYGNRRVKMLVTMGSPLGDPTVRNLLFARHHEEPQPATAPLPDQHRLLAQLRLPR